MNWFCSFSTSYLYLTYGLKFDGIQLENLSPGTKGIVFLILYSEMDRHDSRPLIVDQPEESVDPKSLFKVLTQYFERTKESRVIIMIPHNPNLADNTHSEQVIIASFVRVPSTGQFYA